jgi:hypothetical protein
VLDLVEVAPVGVVLVAEPLEQVSPDSSHLAVAD